jgi:hypothetical protein
MKYCKDCKYLTHNIFCTSPENGISAVTGEPEVQFASTLRGSADSENKCGKLGRNFVLKPEPNPKRPWWDRVWVFK